MQSLKTLKAKAKFYISRVLIKPRDIGSDNITYNGFNGMLLRKNSRLLASQLKKLCIPVVGYINPKWDKRIWLIIRSFQAIHDKQGLVGTVKFLKTCSVVLQQSIGGHVEVDLTSLGPRISRSGDGFPRVLPSDWRDDIRSGKPEAIRMALTCFALYRELTIPAKPKYSTITDGPQFQQTFMDELEKFIPTFTGFFVKTKNMSLDKIKIFSIMKSSPLTKGDESSTSMEALFRTVCQWKSHYKDLLPILVEYINLTDGWFIKSRFWTIFKAIDPWCVNFNKGFPKLPLGKLGFKHEAAGKMRVFAMVDPITQWVLNPLHEFLFSVLAKHKMDGTFNQLSPLKEIPWGTVPIYSYDLSAATDRLPIELQKRLLSFLFSKRMADCWSQLLVGRSYWNRLNGENLVYGTGQPMGALSSWAMLAYTHHFLVQYSAFRCGLFPFNAYAVLGDDIIIWNSSVSKSYLKVMNDLGVKIGLAKSVISPSGGSLEFAKRTFYKGIDVSPIAFSEYRAATMSTSAAVEFCRKYRLTFSKLLQAFGWGWRVTSNVFTTDNLPKNSRILHLFNVFRYPRSAIDIVNRLLVDRLRRSVYGPVSYNWDTVLAQVDVASFLRFIIEDIEKTIVLANELYEEISDVRDKTHFSDPYQQEWQGVQVFSYDQAIEHWKICLRLLILDSNPDLLKRISEAPKLLTGYKAEFKMMEIYLMYMYVHQFATARKDINEIDDSIHPIPGFINISHDRLVQLIEPILKVKDDLAIARLMLHERKDEDREFKGISNKELTKISSLFSLSEKWVRPSGQPIRDKELKDTNHV